MNILKCRTYVVKVNSQVHHCSGLVAFAALAYHSISNRGAAFLSRFTRSNPFKVHFRIIGSYVR